MSLTTRKMSDAHEEHLCEVFGADQMPGSGNQFNKPMDARVDRYTREIAFAIDGKSTRARSMSIGLDMLDKADEQARGQRPMIALRFYGDDRLRTFEDWDLIREEDTVELLEHSRKYSEMRSLVERYSLEQAMPDLGELLAVIES